MDNFPIVAETQQFCLDRTKLKNKFTIQFKSHRYCSVGKLKSPRIVDSGKEILYNFFPKRLQKNTMDIWLKKAIWYRGSAI